MEVGQLFIITDNYFDLINTANKEEIKNIFEPIVRNNFHPVLNRLSSLKNIQNKRKRWISRPKFSTAFGTFKAVEYHWYSFNHGGRSEAQFNIGLYPNRFRIGLGFEFSEREGGDPTSLAFIYTSFINFINEYESAFLKFIRVNCLEIETHDPITDGVKYITNPDEMLKWLVKPEPTEWIFIGRILHRGTDKIILEDEEKLTSLTENIFRGFLPLWEKSNVSGMSTF